MEATRKISSARILLVDRLQHCSVIFSQTGVASTVKLLSALFKSSEGYILGSVDVMRTCK